MKIKKAGSETRLLKIAILLNTLVVVSYLLYSEYEKKQPRLVKHVCQTVGVDKEKNMIAFTCLED